MYQRNKRKEHCLICFNKIDDISFSALLFENKVICEKCKNQFKKIERNGKVSGVDILYLYEYNTFFKSILYQYKGCYDIELNKVFLLDYVNYINKKYKGYIIAYPPSYKDDDIKRGFKHIEKIVQNLKLKNIDIFIKTDNYKQSNTSFNNRKLISDYIKIKRNINIKNKKILIVDDVFTSGQTIKTLINLLLNIGIKKEDIKVLVLSKTKDFVEI